MKFKFPLNMVLGISTEILYTLIIILAAFIICLVVSLKI